MASGAAKPQRDTTPQEWQRMREILGDVLELPFEQRALYLDSVCKDDPQLRLRIDELIAAHDATSAASLDAPAFSITSADLSRATRASVIGRRIGAYRIEAEIAHGGMGTVFRAVRADDEFNKQVAIKLVGGAAFSYQVAEMFRRERQVLASLEHPNIARLLDGGTTEDGNPYLVMEYVEGEPVTEYCKSRQLSIDDRLKLFRKICFAVHYAHQNLVIHRDIKPANILVTKEGEPKLLDFGIAKVIAIDAVSATLTFGALTPAYASPEQISGEPITTATDVYSLGLVLFELLTGQQAFASARSSSLRLQRAILEREPDLPSKAVSPSALESATHLGGERIPREKLARQLKGDLDCIVSKALRKEPVERYSSVAQFSEDVAHYLHRQPVLAHQPTLIYQTRKFLRRHRAGVLTAVLVFALLIAGVVMIVRAERTAKAQQAIAEKRFNDVRKLANSLLFEVHDSIWNLPGATGARKLILQRAQEYLDSLAKDAKSDPVLLRELANAYTRLGNVLGNGLDSNIGNSEQALRNHRKAAELREAVAAISKSNVEDQWKLAQSYMDLSLTLRNTGDRKSEKELLDKALAILEPLGASNRENPMVQYELAKAYERQGGSFAGEEKFEEAKANYERSLAIYERISASEPANANYRSEVAFAHKHLGATLAMQQQFRTGLEHYRAALAIDEEQLSADPKNAHKLYNITFSYSDIGYILGKTGDLAGGLSYYRKAFAIRSRLANADPQDTRAHAGLANTYQYMAGLLSEQGNLKEALEDNKQALRIRKTLSDNDPTNDLRRFEVVLTEATVGEAYAKLAFAPHTNNNQRSSLCQQAQSWFEKALPLLQEKKSSLVGSDSYDLVAAQHAADRCEQVVRILPRQE